MKTLLVLAEHPALPEEISAALDPRGFRVVHRLSVQEAEPLLAHSLADLCIIDANLSLAEGVWILEQFRRRTTGMPLLVFTPEPQAQFEERAYELGAAQVLVKPLRPRLLNAVVERILSGGTAAHVDLAPMPLPAVPAPAAPAAPAPIPLTQLLAPLRSFSGILTQSLSAEGMTRQFLQQVRELFSINRAAIFLATPGGVRHPGFADERRLQVSAALGLPSVLAGNLSLSLDSGACGLVHRLGRIVRRDSAEVRNDPLARSEFEVLGAQVMIPILDRETVLGVAALDCRITGEPLVNSELELLFHLLEQLGLAIRNSWLHDQLAGNHDMLTDVLRELASICVVVNRNLTVVHANKMARKHFLHGERRAGTFDFTDLPAPLGSKVYQVLQTGAGAPTFRYTPESAPETIYSVTVIPFQKEASGMPGSALLIAEDVSQAEQLRKLEIETANLRLLKNMGERVATEVGNAMLPVSVYQQMKDPTARASLEAPFAEGVRRVLRVATQARLLAMDKHSQEPVTLGPLLEEAFQDATLNLQDAKNSKLITEGLSKKTAVIGDPKALRPAFAEIITNGLQANNNEPKVTVRVTPGVGSGKDKCQIDFVDNGTDGFNPETAKRAFEPFFTTRTVGIGLGLPMSRKVIESLGGTIQIVDPKPAGPTTVRVTLPMGS